MSFIREAFEQACESHIKAETWYVILIETVPFYGGPEEGGWWGSDSHVIAWKEYPSKKLAQAAMEGAYKLAKALEDESRKAFGKQCLREMHWLELRGLDADYLPEPDGESKYSVIVSQHIPENTRGNRRYE